MTEKKAKETPKQVFEVTPAEEACKYSESAVVDLKYAVDSAVKQSSRIGLYKVSFQMANAKTWQGLKAYLEGRGYKVELTESTAHVSWGESHYKLAYKLIGQSPVLEESVDE